MYLLIKDDNSKMLFQDYKEMRSYTGKFTDVFPNFHKLDKYVVVAVFEDGYMEYVHDDESEENAELLMEHLNMHPEHGGVEYYDVICE